jgi:putative aldouronate transport system substrate-binding protein
MLDSSTNKVISYYQIPGARESVEALHEWYNKGFFRADLATNIYSGGGDSFMAEGRYLFFSTVQKPGVEAELFAETGHDFSYLFEEIQLMGHRSPLETMIGVSAITNNPIESVKFINMVNTDKDLYNMICYGIEGIHYDKIGENHIELIQDSGYNPHANWKFGNVFNGFLMPGQDDDTWIRTQALNDNAIKSPILGIFFDTDDIRTELAQLARVQGEFFDAFINTGVEHPDNFWDEYVDRLLEGGIEIVLETYQAQIDAFLARR